MCLYTCASGHNWSAARLAQARLPAKALGELLFRATVLWPVQRDANGSPTRNFIKGVTWTSKVAKRMDPILPILSSLRYWAIILGLFWRSR